MSSREVDLTAIAEEGNQINEADEVDETTTEVNMPITTLTSQISNASPFLLKVQDVELLSQSDGFNILREHLAQHYRYEYVEVQYS